MGKTLRKLYYTWQVLKPHGPMPRPLDTTIDVVIPVCEKDLHILPLCLEGVRRMVVHRIAAIYIVAAGSERVCAFCLRHELVFVEERSVLGYGPAELGVRIGPEPGCDRSGWIFQQLLKLSGRVGTSDYFLVIDSDHLLMRPHTFVTASGRLLFYGSSECHEPYYRNIERLMGFTPRSGMSYVAHKMIFSRALLGELHREIERRNGGRRWDRAIVGSLDRSEMSGFSEFELFGNFVPAEAKCMLPWRQKALTYKSIADYETLRRRYAGRYASVTFPAYRSEGLAIPEIPGAEV